MSVAAPYLVAYSDRAWAGNLFFTLCAGVVWLTSRLVSRPGRRAEAFALGALAIAMPQLHLSTVHLVLVAGLALLAFRRRPSFKWLALGALAGALLYAPYLVHELKTDFANTSAIRAHAAGVPARSAAALGNLYLSFLGLATTDLSYLFARGYWYSFDQIAFWSGTGADAMSRVYEQAGAKPLLWLTHVGTWPSKSVPAQDPCGSRRPVFVKAAQAWPSVQSPAPPRIRCRSSCSRQPRRCSARTCSSRTGGTSCWRLRRSRRRRSWLPRSSRG